MNWKAQEKLVRRLVDKIRVNADKIVRNEEDQVDGAEIVVVSYGITSRVARKAIQIARENGVKVGALRMIVVWPFPEKRIAQLSSKVRAFVVPELNYGQMSLEVERAAAGRCATVSVAHGGGEVHDPQVIAEAIMMAARKAA